MAQPASPTASPDPPPWSDPFCSVSIDLDYWDVVENRGIKDAPTSSLLARLYAPGSSVSAHVILLSDTDAYDAAISTRPLTGDKYKHISQQFLIGLPKAMQVRYAYVDSYQLDGSDVVNCPTEVNAFIKGVIGQKAPADIKTVPTFAATYKQALPVLSCGETYTPATVTRPVTPRGIQTGKEVSARIAVFINSDGSIAKSYVYKSSGVDYADDLALDAADRSLYIAAKFLCTPVVGEYIFTVDFEP